MAAGRHPGGGGCGGVLAAGRDGELAQDPGGVGARALGGSADVHHQRAGHRRSRLRQRGHGGRAGDPEDLPHRGHRARIRVRRGDEGDGARHGDRLPGHALLLRTREHLGVAQTAERRLRSAARGAHHVRTRRVPGSEGVRGRSAHQQAADHGSRRQGGRHLEGPSARCPRAGGQGALGPDRRQQRRGALEVGDQPIGRPGCQLTARPCGGPTGRERRRVLEHLAQGRTLLELLTEPPAGHFGHSGLHRSLLARPEPHRGTAHQLCLTVSTS